MQAKFRYLALSIAVFTALGLFYVLTFHSPYQNYRHDGAEESSLYSLLDEDSLCEGDRHVSTYSRSQVKIGNKQGDECSMETCFDFSKCHNGFKVYVYNNTEGSKTTSKYSETLTAIRQSRYYTSDPTQACLFVLSIDTLDRDVLSSEFVHNVDEKLADLPLWNGGVNHLVFNLYSGTWPDYNADLGFDFGKAILAKASLPYKNYRKGFDISFPLFHKEHPFKGGEPGYVTNNNVPPVRQYTLSFKGKRYLHGIGSESRNALYHIHNGKDIILLTTCKHINTPKQLYDERCDRDDKEYDKWDYKVLMRNSTFCLVPRGRRLASYRFLESLQAGCIPVLLSNEYVLPFSEVLEWHRAAVWADERLLLQIPSLVRSVSHTDILSLRQQTQFLWDTYFSSTEKIVLTTLEVIARRIATHLSDPVRLPYTWNNYPGALAVLPQYSHSLIDYPFYTIVPRYDVTVMSPSLHMTSSEFAQYTAVITVTTSQTQVNSPLHRLIKNIAKSAYLREIVILWHSSETPPGVRWTRKDMPHVPMRVITINSINERFLAFREIQTQAVLSLDEDVYFTADEADFAFHVWQHFPSRIVGYESRTHYWQEGAERWSYSSKPTYAYSMVLTSTAFYHKYYGYAYHNVISSELLETTHRYSNCEDILMNFLVSHMTKLPPIKLAQHKPVRAAPDNKQTTKWRTVEHFQQRQECVDIFANHYGYMPLQRSKVRLDPVLFQDDVSITRKKYRVLEHVPSGWLAVPPDLFNRT